MIISDNIKRGILIINIDVFKYFNDFKTDMLNSKETFAQDYFISKTAFKNDDHLMIIVEPIKSSIIEDIKQRTKN